MTDLFALLAEGKPKPFVAALQGVSKEQLTAFDARGQTLLHLAATMKSAKGLEFLDALVKAGVPIDQANKQGDSALHAVIAASSDGLKPAQLAAAEWLLAHGADVNHPGVLQASTLHTAVLRGAQLEFVERLIAAGADGGRKDHTRRNAFFLSMGTGNAPQLWQLLLDKWGGLNEPNERGETPLHEAVSRHNASAVKWLLERNVDQTAKDHKGQTALDHANRYAKKLVPLLAPR